MQFQLNTSEMSYKMKKHFKKMYGSYLGRQIAINRKLIKLMRAWAE